MVESPPEHSSNENEEEVLFSRQMTLDKTEPVSSEHVENIESNNEERVEMKGIVEGTTLPVEEPPKESILDFTGEYCRDSSRTGTRSESFR